ncbi:hypothetical protein EU527_17960 [Candidatus Thorarchaeota archaeon]|nr:MAG: hypothetical protein EU527_17960 [Candidatus Thorarchaeota archaeon]
MEASLRDMLKHGRKFERMSTDQPGVFIRKIPPSVEEPAFLALEINPLDENNLPMSRFGIIIRSKEQLDAVRAIITSECVDEILGEIESVSNLEINDD